MCRLYIFVVCLLATLQTRANTIPDMGLIERAIKVHSLVLVVNASNQGPQAQTLSIFEHGVLTRRVPVSTGLPRSPKNPDSTHTHTGFYRPQRLYRQYLSTQFNELLPNMVFFNRGEGFHAARGKELKRLGQRASHGCVRLTQADAVFVQEKIMEQGRGLHAFNTLKINQNVRILNNSVEVNPLVPTTGMRVFSEKISAWDAVIVVYTND